MREHNAGKPDYIERSLLADMALVWRRAKKTVVAVAGAGVSFGVLVLMSDPGRIQPEEWANLLIGLGVAFGVYRVKNDAT